jgi:type I restriction enzyme, S subunit
MAGEWEETSLSAVMDVKHGFAFPGENICDEPPGDILLTPGNFAIGGGFKGDKFKYFDGEVPADYVLSEGDLIVTMTDLSKQADTLGYPALVPKPRGPRFLHNQRLGKVLIKNGAELDKGFLFYLLRTSEYRHEVLASATGTTVKHTSPGRILAHKASIPPLAEQTSIASILGSLDEKIELNRRMNVTLEAMARALFQSWFVDFDPVHAKKQGKKPPGLDAATAALFPSSFEHAEDVLLPRGWRHAAIEEVCAINSWTLSKNDDLETLEYVEISEVSHGNIGNIAIYPRGEEPSRARRRLRHGDTALSTVRPDRGSYFLSLNPPENRVASTGFAVLTPTKAPWSFLHAALTQPEVSDHLGHLADGGAYPAVRPEIIGAIQVALPNELKILEAFHRLCAPLFEQSEANRTQSRILATLRDTLLPKLLSGELRVNKS